MSRKSKDNRISPTRVDKVVRGVIKSLANPQKLQEAHMFELWYQLVDEEVKKHAAPDRLFGKILYIRTREPIWAHEFTLKHRSRILSLLQQEVGKQNLEDVRFHAKGSI